MARASAVEPPHNQPMIEVLALLRAKGFTNCIATAGRRRQ
jgi:hypothetical protein